MLFDMRQVLSGAVDRAIVCIRHQVLERSEARVVDPLTHLNKSPSNQIHVAANKTLGDTKGFHDDTSRAWKSSDIESANILGFMLVLKMSKCLARNNCEAVKHSFE